MTCFSSNHTLHLPPDLILTHLPQLTKAVFYLLLPTESLYFAIYFYLHGNHRLYRLLTWLALILYWAAGWVSPVDCLAVRCLQNFAVAIATLKALDLYARYPSIPSYRPRSKKPITATSTSPQQSEDPTLFIPTWKLALLLLTELRYESFTPNHIRVPHTLERFSESNQLAVHFVALLVLQFAFPQEWDLIIAYEVLLAIYCIWTAMQCVLRYEDSPALFGPLWAATSLTGFWSETWHNAFASPCTSLAYQPLRTYLPRLGFPVPIARSAGVLGAFALMAVFHMYALVPVLDQEGLMRVGVFFTVNGIATLVEALIWGHRTHWTKAVAAWLFESLLARWTVGGLGIPQGLSRFDWSQFCG